MIFRRISALFEIDLKKVVALSTLRQLGFILTILSFGFFTLCFFHLVVHAFFKSLIFLCTGVLIHTISSQYSKNFGNLNKFSYIIRIFHISRLSLRRVFFISGFFSKDLIVEFFF